VIRVCNQVATATRVPEFWELGVPGTIMTSIDSLRLSNECGVVPRFFLYTEASTLVTRCLKGRVLRGNDWKTKKKWRCRKLQKNPPFRLSPCIFGISTGTSDCPGYRLWQKPPTPESARHHSINGSACCCTDCSTNSSIDTVQRRARRTSVFNLLMTRPTKFSTSISWFQIVYIYQYIDM